MGNWDVRVGLSAVAALAALFLAGCGTTSTFGSGEDALNSGSLEGGSIDGGSFVGRPSTGADGLTTDGDGLDATDDDTDLDDEDLASGDDLSGSDDTSQLSGSPSEDPGLSTDPDVIYFAGTCFVIPSEDAAAEQVGCSEPHTIEVYAIRDLPGGPDGPFLGLDASLELCNEDFMTITGVGLGVATIFTRSVLRPSEETWADGERDVTCYVQYPELTTLALASVNPVREFGLVSIYGMEVGDCFADFDEAETTFVPVSCDDPHDVEIFIDFEFPDGPFPGDELIDETADDLCFGESFESFVGRDYETSAVYSLRSRPNDETWSLGDRTINCLLTDEEVRSGSFEGTGL